MIELESHYDEKHKEESVKRLRQTVSPKPLLANLPETLNDARICFDIMTRLLCRNRQDITIMSETKAYNLLEKIETPRCNLFELAVDFMNSKTWHKDITHEWRKEISK